ncbi:MAG: 16S rRNA (adenine(1518)-N(6)/adenine(1519)-N(6))-dimethyltransferase RsmA [Limisphaerales bacterium]
MKLTDMKQVLAAHDIQLTKSLGQNFLYDANQLRRIVAAANLKKTDRVLEVGPGLGPLTGMLMEQVGEVLAIEKDARLVEILKQRFQTETGGAPVLRLLHDDALDYLGREARDWSEWKLVANLPYSVASSILVELAQAERGPERMVATLQLEVGKRLLAKPGAPDYGVFTLLIQLNYDPQAWFKIPASCFFPEPDVDSACVCLARREPLPLTNGQRKAYVQLVKRSFSQRRKMMLKLLKADWPEQALARAFERLNLPPEIRAEEVSLDQFTQLARSLSGYIIRRSSGR